MYIILRTYMNKMVFI